MPTITIRERVKRRLPKILMDALDRSNRKNTPKITGYQAYLDHVEGKVGIEIGGPSSVFRTVLPVYQAIKELDGVNFANETVWEGAIEAGRNFKFFEGRTGHQYISDATDLAGIAPNTYDFLLSSNCLEHVANPIQALVEWKRVLRNRGAFILVLPKKASNFDHQRPTTSLKHLLEDFNSRTTEHDLTHLDEILALHDLSMDPPAGDLDSFRTRSLANFHNRTLHHHVFDMDLIKSMLRYGGFELISSTETQTDFFTLAIKPH